MESQGDVLRLSVGSQTLLLPKEAIPLFYETWILNCYRSLTIRPGDVVLDIGAAIGDFTIPAARRAGPSGLVLAIEPDPSSYDFLLENIRLNNLRNVIPVKQAVGPKGTVIDIPPLVGFHSSRSEIRTGEGRVTCQPIDAILSANGIDLVDVVKMDIEGAESRAFEHQLFIDRVREIAIEVHSSQLSHEIPLLLASRGFHVFRLTERSLIVGTLRSVLLYPSDVVRAEVFSRGFGLRRIARRVFLRQRLTIVDSSQLELTVLFGAR